MATAKRIRRVLYGVLTLVGALLWLAALLLLSQTAQNSAEFGRLQFWILSVNAAGVAVLLILILGNLIRLVRDYRRHVPGSRLKARLVGMVVVLVALPLALVYGFAVQFLNEGIDSWFDVNVEQGLTDAVELSQTALDIQQRDYLERTEVMADGLAPLRGRELFRELGAMRRETGAQDLSLFTANRRIIATSSENPAAAVPRPPTDEVFFQLRQGRPYVSLEPRGNGGFWIITAVTLAPTSNTSSERILQAFFPVDQRLSRLANEVEQTNNYYRELAFLRDPLKYSFTLTLSLVLLLALLAAVYGAFFAARRLVVPIQQLVAGTRAVAKGDFETRLPIMARDEIGFLVNSFNDMIARLAKAREQNRLTQQQVESERAKLAVILARLSTGVVSLEPDLRIRTANHAAGSILGVDLEDRVGESLLELGRQNPLLGQLTAVCEEHLSSGDGEWREQIVLRGEVGRRVLMCACTSLPGEGGGPGGYVVVFDDITALMQAQRDAAWGEVARRLAHEIKNPLTPIQLSAERLRRRYLNDASADNGQLLERATHTIIQQVEAMKEMVNAFSEYARAPDVEISRFDLNQLIGEVAELYRHQDKEHALHLELADSLPQVAADRGRLRQILHNLLRNAFEALEGRAGARIDVATAKANLGDTSAVRITVSDNGPGFPQEGRDQIFDPYVTSKPKGTGLGLAIVKKMVEEHGGLIRASNREQGGAEISIILPTNGEVVARATVPAQRRERA